MAVAPHHYIAHYDYHATFCRFVVALFVLCHILFYFYPCLLCFQLRLLLQLVLAPIWLI